VNKAECETMQRKGGAD